MGCRKWTCRNGRLTGINALQSWKVAHVERTTYTTETVYVYFPYICGRAYDDTRRTESGDALSGRSVREFSYIGFDNIAISINRVNAIWIKDKLFQKHATHRNLRFYRERSKVSETAVIVS